VGFEPPTLSVFLQEKIGGFERLMGSWSKCTSPFEIKALSCLGINYLVSLIWGKFKLDLTHIVVDFWDHVLHVFQLNDGEDLLSSE